MFNFSHLIPRKSVENVAAAFNLKSTDVDEIRVVADVELHDAESKSGFARIAFRGVAHRDVLAVAWVASTAAR